ncbi:MAG: hypothetical protein ABIA04_07715 [Pseudomonadota bacterium]
MTPRTKSSKDLINFETLPKRVKFFTIFSLFILVIVIVIAAYCITREIQIVVNYEGNIVELNEPLISEAKIEAIKVLIKEPRVSDFNTKNLIEICLEEKGICGKFKILSMKRKDNDLYLIFELSTGNLFEFKPGAKINLSILVIKKKYIDLFFESRRSDDIIL